MNKILMGASCGIAGLFLGAAAIHLMWVARDENKDAEQREVLVACVDLVQQYQREWDTQRKWPAQGTFNTGALTYVPEFSTLKPNDRSDSYRAANGSGPMMDFIFTSDGTIDLHVFKR